MIDRGFIALARGVLDHPIVGAQKQYSDLEAWLWLLFEAAWKPRRIRVTNGRAHGVLDVGRGQLSYSRSYLAKAWGWSEKCVRTFLDRLETDRMIDRQTGQHQTLITICNYETYQNPDAKEGQQKGRRTGRQWAGNGPETEQSNKETKDTRHSRADEPGGFSEWYAIYPRKKQRKAGARAYTKVTKAGEISSADLIDRTRAFAQTWAARPADDLQFCPYPATWLNAGGYLDEPDPGAAPKEAHTPTRDPHSFTPAEWQARLATFRQEGQWPAKYWGPEPGSDGCLVPLELLGGIPAIPNGRDRGPTP